MRSFLKEWPQNPHWFGLMGASLNPNNRTTLSQHSRVRHHSVAGQAASSLGSHKLSKRRKGTVYRANYAKTGHLEWFPLSLSLCHTLCLSFLSAISLSVYFLLGSRRSLAYAARSSSATVSNARTLQCALNCTPPPYTTTYLPILPAAAQRERERKLNCRGKWWGPQWGNAQFVVVKTIRI